MVRWARVGSGRGSNEYGPAFLIALGFRDFVAVRCARLPSSSQFHYNIIPLGVRGVGAVEGKYINRITVVFSPRSFLCCVCPV